MSTAHSKRITWIALALVFGLLQTGCGLGLVATPTETPAPTHTPAPTSTPEPTATPVPTDTPVPTPTTTPDVTATAAARATAAMEDKIAKIAPELEKLGIAPDSGSLVWQADDPISMTVTTYMEKTHYQITDDPVSDFVLFTDVTWNSSSGLAGCGLIFRADDDFDVGGQYAFLIMRLQAAPAWDIEYYKWGQ